MTIDTQSAIIELIKKEVVPALGCTEPIAVALATAKANEFLKGKVLSIAAAVSPNIYKNGMGVGVPGTGMVGLTIAAALGALCGKSSDKLEVLKYVKPENVEEAKKMIQEGKVNIYPVNIDKKLYIRAVCSDGKDTSEVIIENTHTNIVQVKLNDKTVETNTQINENQDNSQQETELNIDEIYDFVINVPLEKIDFILEGAEMNNHLSQIGLQEKSGLGVGANIASNIKNIEDKEELMRAAMARTAAASDARMSGVMSPAMSTAGSGNQGITAMMPVVSAAKTLNSSKEELIRALILSNLTVIYMKKYFGRLSAACGCVIASTGAACGVTYLMGGKNSQIKYSIKNMIGNLTGMICDGAKLGCALKVASGTSAAVQSAFLAMDNICISANDGIIDESVDTTIQNIGKIGREAMDKVDNTILEIMVNKR